MIEELVLGDRQSGKTRLFIDQIVQDTVFGGKTVAVVCINEQEVERVKGLVLRARKSALRNRAQRRVQWTPTEGANTEVYLEDGHVEFYSLRRFLNNPSLGSRFYRVFFDNLDLMLGTLTNGAPVFASISTDHTRVIPLWPTTYPD